ncbi:MAG: HNH endonuclease [Nitrospinae bacterium]|nr:HNH endonuclease [Nitrospinota bacterium]
MKNAVFSLLFCAMFVAASFADEFMYPDSKLTPGSVDASATTETLCAITQFKAINAVDPAMEAEVFKRYEMNPKRWPCPCEVDHFIPLELGGSGDLDNLWPQPYHTDVGARMKDSVEKRLHRELCAGSVSLERAQEIIKDDWYACYLKLNDGDLCQ